MIRRIGEVLSLEAEGVPAAVGDVPAADEASVEGVSGVELEPRLGGENLENPTRLRIRRSRREGRRRLSGSQDEAVIVAAASSDQGVDGGSERSR